MKKTSSSSGSLASIVGFTMIVLLFLHVPSASAFKSIPKPKAQPTPALASVVELPPGSCFVKGSDRCIEVTLQGGVKFKAFYSSFLESKADATCSSPHLHGRVGASKNDYRAGVFDINGVFRLDPAPNACGFGAFTPLAQTPDTSSQPKPTAPPTPPPALGTPTTPVSTESSGSKRPTTPDKATIQSMIPIAPIGVPPPAPGTATTKPKDICPDEFKFRLRSATELDQIKKQGNQDGLKALNAINRVASSHFSFLTGLFKIPATSAQVLSNPKTSSSSNPHLLQRSTYEINSCRNQMIFQQFIKTGPDGATFRCPIMTPAADNPSKMVPLAYVYWVLPGNATVENMALPLLTATKSAVSPGYVFTAELKKVPSVTLSGGAQGKGEVTVEIWPATADQQRSLIDAVMGFLITDSQLKQLASFISPVALGNLKFTFLPSTFATQPRTLYGYLYAFQ